MQILDRTMIRGFFLNLILWGLALSGIIIVSDLVTHFDDFVDDKATVNPISAIASYYFYFCLRLADMIVVFIILISALNILANMFRRNEIIALMAMGAPPKRVIFPLLIAAVFCSAGMCWLRESFVPSRMIRFCGSREFFTQKSAPVDVIPAQDEWTRLKVNGQSVTPDGERILQPVFTLPAQWGSEPRVLRAEEAIWRRASGGLGEGYLLRGVQNAAEFFAEGAIDTAGNTRSPADGSAAAPSGPEDAPPLSDGTGAEDGAAGPPAEPENRFDPENIMIYTPGEAPGTGPDEVFVLCGVSPAFLAVGEEWISYASTSGLIAALQSKSLPYRDVELLTHIHQRVVKPVSDLFPLLLALPLLFVYKDGNPYKRMAFAALIAALYVGAGYFIEFTCRASLPSTLCAFLPMILFLPVVAILFRTLDDC